MNKVLLLLLLLLYNSTKILRGKFRELFVSIFTRLYFCFRELTKTAKDSRNKTRLEFYTLKLRLTPS